MTWKIQAIISAVALALAFIFGWTANGWRLNSEIARMKADHAAKLYESTEAALARYETMERTKDEAIRNAQIRAGQLQADAARAASAADGLRKQLAAVPERIATASRAAVDEYAATAGELLVACTSEYQWMARKADEHANAERTLMEAWPKQ